MFELSLLTVAEAAGSILAVVGALIVASNTGRNVLGFRLMAVSASLLVPVSLIAGFYWMAAMHAVFLGINVFGLVRWADKPKFHLDRCA